MQNMISNRDFNNTKTALNKTKTKAGSYNLLKLFADINISRRLVTASRSPITTIIIIHSFVPPEYMQRNRQ